MAVVTIPEKKEYPLGIVKQDILPDPNTQVVQYERIKDAVIAIGLGDGSTPNSTVEQLSELDTPTLQSTYETGDTTGAAPVTTDGAAPSEEAASASGALISNGAASSLAQLRVRRVPTSVRGTAVMLLLVSGCDAVPVDRDGGPSAAADATDAPESADAGAPGLPRFAVAHFAQSAELEMVDICAVPMNGDEPIRVGEALGVAGIGRGDVTNSIEIAPGRYTFTAITAGTTDCTDALRGFTLPISLGAEWLLVVGGGTGPGEATPVLARLDRRSAGSSSEARIRAVQLAVDTATGIGGFGTDLSVDVGDSEVVIGMGASFGRTGSGADADAAGYVAVPPDSNLELVVRPSGASEELGRSPTFMVEAGHTYTAYVSGYAFMGESQVAYSICDERDSGGTYASCQ